MKLTRRRPRRHQLRYTILRAVVRGGIQEVPYQDRVVVRTADDLELVELQTEHPSRVLLRGRQITSKITKLAGENV